MMRILWWDTSFTLEMVDAGAVFKKTILKTVNVPCEYLQKKVAILIYSPR